jgi:O-antigen ligase
LEKNINSITDVERNLSNLERFNRWMAAVNMIKAHPVMGVGYGTYPIRYLKYRDRRLETPVSDFYGFPHNDYLQYFAETGIFGFTAWMGFLVLLFTKTIAGYYRIRDEFARNLLIGCLGGILTYLTHALFNGFLQTDKVAVPFWVLVALILILLETHEGKRDPKSAIHRGAR